LKYTNEPRRNTEPKQISFAAGIAHEEDQEDENEGKEEDRQGIPALVQGDRNLLVTQDGGKKSHRKGQSSGAGGHEEEGEGGRSRAAKKREGC